MSIGFGNFGRMIWDRPLVLKSMIVGSEISWIARVLPVALFVDLVPAHVQWRGPSHVRLKPVPLPFGRNHLQC